MEAKYTLNSLNHETVAVEMVDLEVVEAVIEAADFVEDSEVAVMVIVVVAADFVEDLEVAVTVREVVVSEEVAVVVVEEYVDLMKKK
jgi:hypothetical protein